MKVSWARLGPTAGPNGSGKGRSLLERSSRKRKCLSPMSRYQATRPGILLTASPSGSQKFYTSQLLSLFSAPGSLAPLREFVGG